MKKVILFSAVIAAFSFASCKKDHVCTCTTVYNPGANSYTEVTTYTKSKKGDAMSHCLSATGTQEIGGTTYTSTRTCDLK